MSRAPALWIAIAACLVGGCKPNKDAMEVLRQNRDAMFALQAYRATCATTLVYDNTRAPRRYSTAYLTAEKPNKMRYDSWSTNHAALRQHPESTPEYTFASDGAVEYLQFGKNYEIRKNPVPEMMSTILEPWEGFYFRANSVADLTAGEKSKGELRQLKYDGVENVGGVSCDKVSLRVVAEFAGTEQDHRATYFIGQSDHFVRREVEHITFDGKSGFTRDAVISDIETHPKIDASVYHYSPPPGVQHESTAAHRPALLTLGKPAPDFAGIDQNGKRIRLSSLRGNIVLLDFWASWCVPCVESMTYMQQMTKGFHDTRLSVVELSVDDGEPRANFDNWVSDNHEKYPDLRFAYVDPKLRVSTKLYRVSAIPTQYVIDQKGIIRAAYEGFDGSNRLYDAMCAVIYVPPGMKIPNVK